MHLCNLPASLLFLFARNLTMRFGNLPLLHQLAEEYNTAVNHALSSYVPKDLSTFEDDCDSTIIEGDDDDRDDDDDELGYE